MLGIVFDRVWVGLLCCKVVTPLLSPSLYLALLKATSNITYILMLCYCHSCSFDINIYILPSLSFLSQSWVTIFVISSLNVHNFTGFIYYNLLFCYM